MAGTENASARKRRVWGVTDGLGQVYSFVCRRSSSLRLKKGEMNNVLIFKLVLLGESAVGTTLALLHTLKAWKGNALPQPCNFC